MYARRGVGGFFAPDCAGLQCTSQEVTNWCRNASALAPLSYVLCLKQDVGTVASGTADKVADIYTDIRYPNLIGTPPTGKAPGAPQTQEQMTVPGAYTPEQSAADAQKAYKAAVDQFFEKASEGGEDADVPWLCKYLSIGCDGGFSLPSWLWVAGAVVGGVVALNVLGTATSLGGRR